MSQFEISRSTSSAPPRLPLSLFSFNPLPPGRITLSGRVSFTPHPPLLPFSLSWFSLVLSGSLSPFDGASSSSSPLLALLAPWLTRSLSSLGRLQTSFHTLFIHPSHSSPPFPFVSVILHEHESTPFNERLLKPSSLHRSTPLPHLAHDASRSSSGVHLPLYFLTSDRSPFHLRQPPHFAPRHPLRRPLAPNRPRARFRVPCPGPLLRYDARQFSRTSRCSLGPQHGRH